MIKRIKNNYPKYKFIITGDALYATTPIIKICEKYKWNYIFNLKPDRLKEINESFEDNINYQNETTHNDLEIKDPNIKEIVSIGRKRWKIENKAFYTQKGCIINSVGEYIINIIFYLIKRHKFDTKKLLLDIENSIIFSHIFLIKGIIKG